MLSSAGIWDLLELSATFLSKRPGRFHLVEGDGAEFSLGGRKHSIYNLSTGLIFAISALFYLRLIEVLFLN